MVDPVHDTLTVRVAELAAALADAHCHFTYPVWQQSEKLLAKDWVQEGVQMADDLKALETARIRDAARNVEPVNPLAMWAGGIPYA